MARLTDELELLNKICHTCECMVNGKKIEQITEEDLKKGIEVKQTNQYETLPLYSYSPQLDDKQMNEG